MTRGFLVALCGARRLHKGNDMMVAAAGVGWPGLDKQGRLKKLEMRGGAAGSTSHLGDTGNLHQYYQTVDEGHVSGLWNWTH
jgi:hypothetical protein